jgi:hypothetical protein
MTIILRTPANHGQLTSGDPLGSSSCVAYSFAYAVSHATGGVFHPTGRQIRSWTGDTLGGLELSQCDRAVTNNSDLEPMTGVWTEEQFYGYVEHGWHAVLLGGYAPIEASAFSGQPGFFRNHAIWVPALTRDGDPLADGRRSGIYKYHAASYGRLLTNRFAAALRDSTGHNVGPNHFEASLIRSTGLSSGTTVSADHEVSVARTSTLRRYLVDFDHRWVLSGSWHSTGGFTARCTGRQLFYATKLVDGVRHTDYSEPRYIVRLLSGAYGDEKLGSRKGWWINVNDPDVHLRRLA